MSFMVSGFEGPLDRLTYKAKGNRGYWRVGVRGASKEQSSPSVDFPSLTEVEEAYSLDFAPVLDKASAAGTQFQYPITEVVFGFRFRDHSKEVVEISDLILHAKE